MCKPLIGLGYVRILRGVSAGAGSITQSHLARVRPSWNVEGSKTTRYTSDGGSESVLNIFKATACNARVAKQTRQGEAMHGQARQRRGRREQTYSRIWDTLKNQATILNTTCKTKMALEKRAVHPESIAAPSCAQITR